MEYNLEVKEQRNHKPVWFWFYSLICLVLFLFGLYVLLVDTTGYGSLVAIPSMILGIIMLVISYSVYYWKKNNKKLIGNLILGTILLFIIGFFIYGIIQTVIWYDVVGIRPQYLIIDTVFMMLFLKLLIVLNKREE